MILILLHNLYFMQQICALYYLMCLFTYPFSTFKWFVHMFITRKKKCCWWNRKVLQICILPHCTHHVGEQNQSKPQTLLVSPCVPKFQFSSGNYMTYIFKKVGHGKRYFVISCAFSGKPLCLSDCPWVWARSKGVTVEQLMRCHDIQVSEVKV